MAKRHFDGRPERWLMQYARPMHGGLDDYDALLAMTQDAHVVLLGGSTHGTSEFYMARAAITRRLVSEHGFSLIAVEGDWPAALHVNRYLQGEAEGPALEALSGFRRFPAWLWRNNVVLDLVGWLKKFNEPIPKGSSRVGFYGLDLFNLPMAISESFRQIARFDRKAAQRARQHLACLGSPTGDSRESAFDVGLIDNQCRQEVLASLQEIQRTAEDALRRGCQETQLNAEMAALSAVHSGEYYRMLLDGDGRLWNLRDRHMAQVIDRLLASHGPGARAVIWAHNSHVGDAAATAEGESGKVNLGRILREKYGQQVVSVGFGTYEGTVTAARDWDRTPEFMALAPAKPRSLEAIFHGSRLSRCFLDVRNLKPGETPADSFLYRRVPERSVGVVINRERPDIPEYVAGKLGQKYDAYFFYDKTLAIEPLDLGLVPRGLEAYPTGE